MRRATLALACSVFVPPAVSADAVPVGPEVSRYVEAQLREYQVPGAAIAVIRSYAIDGVQGYGVANTLTRRLVTPETVFSVASNGKPVAAYLAVVLAEQRVIDLESPVMVQAELKLPSTPFHGEITPAHLLAHSSGLGNFLRDRERRVEFRPGERFAYSGVGFVVLQELLESRTGRQLDDLARELVFRPAGMNSSAFGVISEFEARIAPGHIHLIRALAPFAIVVTPLFLLAVGAAAMASRIRSKRWRIGWAAAGIAFALASAAAFVFLLQRSGSWRLALWFSAIPAAGFVLLGVTTALPRRRIVGALVAAVLGSGLWFAREISIPLPAGQAGRVEAASSLRATAGDLARFMIELARPAELDRGAVATMTRPINPIDEASAWGLGIGIEEHAGTHDLWHWGSNPGSKSLMIISPETGDGVVVLTNGSEGSQPMRNIAAFVLGRQGCWRPGCAE